MTLGKRERILAGVLGILAMVAVLAFWGGGDRGRTQVRETLSARSGRLRAAAAQAPLVGDVVALDLAALEGESGEFEVGRNPFRYAPEPIPRPEPTPQQQPPTPPPPAPEPTPPPAPDPDRCRPPSSAHLQYLGSFGRKGFQIAVVVNGDEIYNVREGEMIGDDFRVEEIGYESLALRSVACPDEPVERLAVGGS